MSRVSRTARMWWTVLALVVTWALITDLVLSIAEPDPAGNVGTSVIRLFSYFTIESNILVLAAIVPLIANPNCDGTMWRIIRLSSLAGITITGIVYGIVLAPASHPQGLHVWVNLGLHYVSPVMSIVGWLVFGPRPRIDGRIVAAALVWPVAWVGYTMLHGAVARWYPYDFIDVLAHGYAVVLRNIAVIFVIALALLLLACLIDRRLRPVPR